MHQFFIKGEKPTCLNTNARESGFGYRMSSGVMGGKRKNIGACTLAVNGMQIVAKANRVAMHVIRGGTYNAHLAVWRQLEANPDCFPLHLDPVFEQNWRRRHSEYMAVHRRRRAANRLATQVHERRREAKVARSKAAAAPPT